MGTVQAISRLKSLVRQGVAGLYSHMPGCLSQLRGKVSILTYHRVIPLEDVHMQCVQPGMYVTPDMFERHLAFLSAEFQLISFSELLALWTTCRWDAMARYCVITFDDGWLDTYRHAWPALQRHRIPATVFLPTAFIETDRWFWPDRLGLIIQSHFREALPSRQDRFRRLVKNFPWLMLAADAFERGDTDAIVECWKVQPQEQIDACLEEWIAESQTAFPSQRVLMNWKEACEMSSGGVEFGSHSVSHRILTTLSQPDVAREAAESMAMLREKGLSPIPVFCYPNGNWSTLVADQVRAAGYRAATTTQFGHEEGKPASWFGIKRINMHQGIAYNESLLAFHLAGFNDWL